MAEYRKYEEYKDSGVEWLGEIPKDWEMWKIAHAYLEIGSGTTPPSSNEAWYVGDIPWVTTGELREKIILDTKKKISKKTIKAFPTLRVYPVGSIAIAMYGATIGRLGILGVEATTNQACCVMSESNVIFNKFLYYWMQAFKDDIVRLSSGGGQPNINQEIVASLKVSTPRYKEQVHITNFLDHETAQIDTLIDKQQTLIQLLKEKHQAVISHAVTPNKDEESTKLGYFIDILSGYSFPSAGYQVEAEGNTALLRGINVGVGALKWDETVWWSRTDRDGLEAFELEEGDIVFGMDRPWISAGARVAEVTKSDLPCLLLQRVIRIRANKNTYQPFIKLCLASKEFKFSVEADLTGVSVPHISPDQVKSFPIRDIGYEQQKLITDDAFKKMKVLDLIEDSAEQAIQLMQERRTALISAAVTGKIDVRGWQAPDIL